MQVLSVVAVAKAAHKAVDGGRRRSTKGETAVWSVAMELPRAALTIAVAATEGSATATTRVAGSAVRTLARKGLEAPAAVANDREAVPFASVPPSTGLGQ